MIDWDATAEKISAKLQEVGQLGSIVRKRPASYNITTGAITDTTPEETWPAYLIVTKFDNPDGEYVKMDDLKIVASVPVGFDVKDKQNLFVVLASGRRCQIININVASPAGVDLVYRIHARG
jgi:hypothetical protein